MKKFIDTIIEWFDILLPLNFKEQVSIRFYYRARIMAVINMVTAFLITIVFLLSLKFIKRSITPIIGIGSISLYLTLTVVYFKNVKTNFEKKFFYATFFQIILLTLVIYGIGFSYTGLGFFGMIWFSPLLLMLTYYFDPKVSFASFAFFITTFIYVIFSQHQNFFLPIVRLPNFSKIFMSILVINFSLIFIISWFYSILMEQLQLELSSQRELLIASAKFNSLGKMTSTMAHEVNNPLFLLQSRLHLIHSLVNKENVNKDECNKIISASEQTIEKLSTIVKGISNYARDGHVDEMIVMSANDLVKSNLDVIADHISKSGIDLKIETSNDVDIICHPSYLSQVILNLVQNSIDALEESTRKEITVKIEKQNTDVNISVIDSGPGIPEIYIEKIYKPFFTTKKYQKGTGLGLSISQGLVELHHGKLKYSRIQDTTCFLVQLPHADSLMN